MSESSHEPDAAPAPGASRRVRNEFRERVELCRKLLASHVSECDVGRALEGKLAVDGRTARRCLALARQRMLSDAGRSRESHVADAYAFYCSLISRAETKDADRIKAQERIEKLLGLEPATRGETFGGDGEPLTLPWLLTTVDHSEPPPARDPPNMLKGEVEYDRRTEQGET